MIEIILESFNSLFRAIDTILKTKDLTLGAILAGLAPFIALWMKLSREKEKKARAILVERRQLQIAFNVNEIMESLKVESKWSIQEIGLPNTDHKNLKTRLKSFSKRKGVLQMKKWTSRKFLMAILAAVLPIINEQFDLGLDTNVIIAAIGGIVAFILGEAHIDAKRAKKAEEATITTETTTVQPVQVATKPDNTDTQNYSH